ncbi:MAG: hypothetical protein J7L46_06795 [Bacteroidales bacterium]|nr:hypothetical protein [Bacteroidales bacterium]
MKVLSVTLILTVFLSGCQLRTDIENAEKFAAGNNDIAENNNTTQEIVTDTTPTITESSVEETHSGLRIDYGDFIFNIPDMLHLSGDEMPAPVEINIDTVENPTDLSFTVGMAQDFDNGLEENVLYIENSKVSDLKIYQQFGKSLLFNEDGSGGVFQLDNIGTYYSEWEPLEISEENTVEFLSAPENPIIIPEDDLSKAKEYCDIKEVETNFHADFTNVKLKLTWTSADATSMEYEINFIDCPGD